MYAIARRYGMSKDSVARHSANHLPDQLRAKLIAGPDLDIDLDRLRETESQSILMHLASLRARLFASLDTAEECGDGAMLAQLSGQIHKNLELVAKLVGDLAVGGSVTNNILIAPVYVELRHALFAALTAFPDARIAVAAALHSIEHRAADDIATADRSFAGAHRKPPKVIEHAAPTLAPPPY
jgi:hypothetical protein